MVDSPDVVDLFNFMVVRSPYTVEPALYDARYVHDPDATTSLATTHPSKSAPVRGTAPLISSSAILQLIFTAVFCASKPAYIPKAIEALLEALTKYLPRFYPPCGDPPSRVSNTGIAPKPLDLHQFPSYASFWSKPYYYVLPDRVELIDGFPWKDELALAETVLAGASAPFDAAAIGKGLNEAFGGGDLESLVFNGAGYATTFDASIRALFDSLYLCYIFRRKVNVNLENLMSALRALHVLEAFAIDAAVNRILQGSAKTTDTSFIAWLAQRFASLKGWNGGNIPFGFPRTQQPEILTELMEAIPIIPPLVAQLYYLRWPFNDIKPLGIGDLKVVRQWLTAYISGEISDIHNVMKNETKSRIHRRLEKTESTYSYTSEQQQDSTKDTQSTDRYELKKEAENVIKTNLNVGANTSISATYTQITANVGANFAYSRDSTDTTKSSENLWREVVSKAISRVQSRTVEQRSVTQIFETRETNVHKFANAGMGSTHLSGIYRWLEKEYQAQVFNFGKRMMFEFILPEPGTFFVQMRLRQFEVDTQIPKKPTLPPRAIAKLKFKPTDITESLFASLQEQYDLGDMKYPLMNKEITFIDQESRNAYFKETGLPRDWYAKTFVCTNEPGGYEISKLHMKGEVVFHGRHDTGTAYHNTIALNINGQDVPDALPDMESALTWVFPADGGDYSLSPGIPLPDDGTTANVLLGFRDIDQYYLTFTAELTYRKDAMLEWQRVVHRKVVGIEQDNLNTQYQQAMSQYENDLRAYQNAISALKAQAVNDLTQGRSADNQLEITRELKRQSLSILTKEFDADTSDDLLSRMESMSSFKTTAKVNELSVDDTVDPIKYQWTLETRNIDLPALVRTIARSKGRHIQFLEQAFDWTNLSFNFYPYFWATPSKWLELLRHSDARDQNLTDFLQAGAAKVLVAVTPAYEDAVLHYLATREPWEGGPAPVIGDPLYIPLYEELKHQTDDLDGATPEGTPWTFRLPTSLVYLEGSSTALPTITPPYPKPTS